MAHLDIRERKLDNKDSGVERMMKGLRIKEDEIDSKNAEIQELKSEIDERMCCAREDHDREWKVWCVCVSDVMCLGMLFVKEYDRMFRVDKGGYERGYQVCCVWVLIYFGVVVVGWVF